MSTYDGVPHLEPLGQKLLAKGFVTPEQLQNALAHKRQNGGFIGEIIVELGYAASKDVGTVLAEAMGVSFVDLSHTSIDPLALATVTEAFQRRHKVMPFKWDGRLLYVAMADPLNVMVVDDLNVLTGFKTVPVLAFASDIQAALQKQYSARSAAETVIKEIESSEPAPSPELTVAQLVDLAEDAPIIRLVNSIISGAIDCAASDIHIEPQETSVRVRYRQDGILYEQMCIPASHHPAVVSRTKIMAQMNIAERRRPQDGRISFQFGSAAFDLRVSTLPTIFGEKIVMRILDKAGILVPLNNLGFLPEQLILWQSFLRRPHGIILVTGPTGSGKSTTLYTSLNQINDVERNIITVEDPVEYNLPGISQVQANARIGLTFAAGLRTILRQDPDVIMVGEIRDTETAEIAVQAALTGHLVFSTLHTNDAPGALVRLQNMGVENFLIASAVLGVVGQRLLRKVCSQCVSPDSPDPALLRSIGINPLERHQFVAGKGCARCNGRGYRGRTAAYEVMSMNDRLRDALMRNMGGAVLKEMALESGMVAMRDAAIRKATLGETTVEEVARLLMTGDEAPGAAESQAA